MTGQVSELTIEGEVFPAKQADERPGSVVWLNGQRNWDLWHALHAETAGEIETIEPVGA